MPYLIKGANVFTPKFLGKKDVLILEEKIAAIDVNFQRFPTLDAKKLVNAPKMSAHHRGICHF